MSQFYFTLLNTSRERERVEHFLKNITKKNFFMAFSLKRAIFNIFSMHVCARAFLRRPLIIHMSAACEENFRLEKYTR
jgi:hypothetical protein